MARQNFGWCFYKIKASSHDQEIDEELKLDEVTWLQMLSTALKRSHGIFGEAIEYQILHIYGTEAVVKASAKDVEVFETSLTSYTANEELVGSPLVLVLQEKHDDLREFDVKQEDEIWFTKLIEQNALDEDGL